MTFNEVTVEWGRTALCTDEDRRRAALQAALHSRGRSDLEGLLDALGLLP